MFDITLYCYRYHTYLVLDYDEETIWRDVQSWGGSLSIRADSIDFWVPRAYHLWFILRYPELPRQPLLEYV